MARGVFVFLVALGIASPGWATPVAQSSESTLSAAEAAFVAKRYERAAALAARLRGSSLGSRGAYVEGYALYKLRRLEAAAKALERALAIAKPRVEARFLYGLVAFERQRWALCRSTLEPLAGDTTWGPSARALAKRAEARERAAALAKAKKEHRALIRKLEGQLRAGELSTATKTLMDAEKARPGHALNAYYRGYLAYQRGDREKARREFRGALSKRPNDVWARYMLALSVDARQREPLLREVLRESKDPALRRAATAALVKRAPRASRRHVLSMRVALGSGYDSNPALANASNSRVIVGPAAPPSDATDEGESGSGALSLQVEGELGYRYSRGRHQISLSLQGLERLPLAGEEGIAQTDLGAWALYALRLGSVWLQASYAASLFLFDHDLALSNHAFSLQLTTPTPLRGLSVNALSQLRLRDAHDDDYRYIDGLEIAGSVGVTYRWRWLEVSASYGLLRGLYDPFSFDLGEPPPGETDAPVYVMDYTFWGHGPTLAVELALPWKLTLSANAWLLWQHFDDDEAIINPRGRVDWRGGRRDTQLIVQSELRRPLLLSGLQAALRYRLEHNGSTLAGDAPLDRGYSRHLMLLVLSYSLQLP